MNGERLIDGRVRSDSEGELRARVRLIGGRSYPVVLHARRTREPDLRLTLLWKRPGRSEEIIPTRYLSPREPPPVHATTVRLPPDDRSTGYVRGASVSAAWDDAATTAAIETARHVMDHLPALAGLGKGGELIARDEAIAFSERSERSLSVARSRRASGPATSSVSTKAAALSSRPSSSLCSRS